MYVLPVKAVTLRHLVPLVHYSGPHPTAPLKDGAHAGFTVAVALHLGIHTATKGTVTVAGAWSSAVATVPVDFSSPSDVVVRVNLTASAKDVELWWPVGVGAHRLYNVTGSFTPDGGTAAHSSASMVAASRLIGFRHVTMTTANDTDRAVVAAGGDGSAHPTFTTFFRVNGARIYARGGNMVPMDELEARVSDRALRQLIYSAAAANMNAIRIWGGGIYYPESFYSAADEQGVLIYHDLIYAQEGHSACCPWYGPCWYGRCTLPEAQSPPFGGDWSTFGNATSCSCDTAAGRTQEAEIRHQVRTN